LSPIEDFPVEKWNQIIEINLNSVFHTMRLTLPAMKERGYGRIINISSVHGIYRGHTYTSHTTLCHTHTTHTTHHDTHHDTHTHTHPRGRDWCGH
jgi:NAD(P)-dependent dehydrogenase (short-subunit alcohol dehydrogenase family)